ncbi:MAG: leucine-rich repeat protein [Lachnospiraceae bacterium]|nr:leucine-rich repeat protein [Lachnospiraceae bacterium]
MKRFRSGRVLGLILAAALFATAVPAEAFANEDIAASAVAADEENSGYAESDPAAAEGEIPAKPDEEQIPEADGAKPAEETPAVEALSEEIPAEAAEEDLSGAENDDELLQEEAAEEAEEKETEEELLGGAEVDTLKRYLRPNANVGTLEQKSGIREGTLGSGVKSVVYTYKADGIKYTALYIWSDSPGAVLKGYTVSDASAYGTGGDYKSFTDLILDDSITQIETPRAFEELENVSYVRLSQNLKSFSLGLFEECTGLESITIPKSLETAGGNTFWRCKKLKTINFEDGIKKIPDYFAKNGDSYTTETQIYECAVETVNIPASVTDIGDGAFTHLRHLTTVNFMDPANTTLAHIGFGAFSDTYLNSITLPKFGGKWVDPYDKKTYTAVIEGLAFDDIDNPQFKTLIIPEGVVTVNELWENDRYLEYIYLPSTLKCTDNTYDQTCGANEAFFGKMPSSIKQIYYNGSENQFFSKALQVTRWKETWKKSYAAVYAKLSFNTPAPKQVSGITVAADQTSIIKYVGEITGTTKDEILLSIEPATHTDTVYKVSVTGDPIVEASLGAETDGRVKLTLKNYSTVPGHATVTVTGGLASAEINVYTRNAGTVATPVFKLNGRIVSGTISVKKGDWISVESDTRDSYTLCKIDSAARKEYPNGFTVGKDILKDTEDGDSVTITAQSFKDHFTASATKSVTLVNRFDWGDVSEEDLDERDHIPDGLWIPNGSYEEEVYYTGSAITIPDLKVFYYNKRLLPGKGYTVSYKDNTDSKAVSGRDASFTVTGKAPYTGTATGSYTILQKELNGVFGESVYSYTPVTLTYTGAEQTADIGFTYEGRKLILGKDYSVGFKREGDYSSMEKVKEPGMYNVAIYGENNYIDAGGGIVIAGAVCVIDLANSVNLNAKNVTVAKIKDQQLVKPGVEVKAAFTVSYKKKQIDPDCGAFTYEYKNNKTAGTAQLILRGTGNPVVVGDETVKFMGTRTVTYKIKPIKMTPALLTCTLAEQTYTGSALTPFPTVTYDGATLYTSDYKATYSNNVKAGNATVTITGTGSYTGSRKFSFKINKAALTASDVEIASGTYPYTVGGVKPEVSVKIGLPSDVTITYTNNNAPGTGTVTVKGKGGLTGEVKKTFSIIKGDLSRCTTSFTDQVYANKAGKYKQNLKITDTNGKNLSAGKDYDKTFEYTYAEDTVVKQAVGKTYTDVFRAAGDAVNDKDIIPARTTVKVVVNGKGNYAGSKLTGTFRFASANITSLQISVDAQKFTGYRILPGKDQIHIKKVAVEPNDAYEIIGYGANVNTGTGTVMIRGKGNYAGTRTLSFRITK